MFLSYKSARTMFTSGMLTSCTSLSSWTCSSYENWFVLFNNALNRHTHAVVVQPFRSWRLRPQAHGSNEAYYPSAAFRSFSWLNVEKKVFFFSASGFFFHICAPMDNGTQQEQIHACDFSFLLGFANQGHVWCCSRLLNSSNRRLIAERPLHSKPREEF